MRIHYLLFAFLLVLLSPLASFRLNDNNRHICHMQGGSCHRRCFFPTHQIGMCTSVFKCCKRL
ncbi:beta-defensin 8-like [Mus pahari]|uniref:beta-defensin 8-like n=1 Tax=Mus pahari TaxID=10093 RepID=UPI000A30A167|nr:beta-defensin 8-like [Mus pahari]